MLIFANTTAEYDLIPELTFKINLGLNRTVASRNSYEPTILPYAAAFGGRAVVANNTRQNVLFETTLNYRLDIDAGQRLQAWAGYTFQEFDNFQTGATGADYVTDSWYYNNLAGGADFTERPTSWRDSNRLISFLGRATYSLHGKYLFNAAVRQEGSSRFGEDNKWGTFPSASVGWRLSEESFMQGMGSLSDLKLRLSYGITGNQDIGNYRSLVILGPGANAVIGDEVRTGVASTQLANPDLKWEETTQTNLGIDFGLLENKISGSIDLYTKTTDDLLIEYSVPQPAVVSTAIDNAGKVKNEGIEIMLNSINIASGDWFWRTSLNFTSNKNEVVSLGTREYIMTGQIGGAGLSDTQAQIVLPGEPLYTFFGPRFLGYDEDGAEILSNHPGNSLANSGPLNDGRFILGNARPDWTLGFTSITQWKKWDFRFNFNWVYGNDILNNTAMEYQRPSNVFNGINLLSGAVDDVNNGMDPGATTAYSDRFIEDGSFIRLQNVTVGYTFDTAWFRTLRVYLSADNLFVLTDYTGYDPEVNTYAEMSGVSTMGMDYTNYPRARTFTVGLNIGIR
jgi:iron complex outermembrane receptor protein